MLNLFHILGSSSGKKLTPLRPKYLFVQPTMLASLLERRNCSKGKAEEVGTEVLGTFLHPPGEVIMGVLLRIVQGVKGQGRPREVVPRWCLVEAVLEQVTLDSRIEWPKEVEVATAQVAVEGPIPPSLDLTTFIAHRGEAPHLLRRVGRLSRAAESSLHMVVEDTTVVSLFQQESVVWELSQEQQRLLNIATYSQLSSQFYHISVLNCWIGGATTPYTSGGRSPLGITPLFLGAGALAFFPAAWLYGAYNYPYGHPYSFHNRTGRANNTANSNNVRRDFEIDYGYESGVNETKPVTCLCAAYAECGCDASVWYLVYIHELKLTNVLGHRRCYILRCLNWRWHLFSAQPVRSQCCGSQRY